MSEIYSPLSLQALTFRTVLNWGCSDQLRNSPLKHEVEVWDKFDGLFQIVGVQMQLFKINGDRASNSDWPKPDFMDSAKGWSHFMEKCRNSNWRHRNKNVPDIREPLLIRTCRDSHPHIKLFYMATTDMSDKMCKPMVMIDWKLIGNRIDRPIDGPPTRRRPQVFARCYYENRTLIREHISLWTQNTPPTSDQLEKVGRYLSVSQSGDLDWVWKLVSKHERWYLDDEENLVWEKSHAILYDPLVHGDFIKYDDFVMTVKYNARRYM